MGDQPRIEDLLASPAMTRLRALFDGRPDALVALHDTDGSILWASPANASSMFGRDTDAFVGRPALDFIHPDDQDEFLAAITRANRGSTADWHGRASDVDGNWKHVHTTVWATGERDAFIAVTVPAQR
jgi:PAS domain S-box-containing protein